MNPCKSILQKFYFLSILTLLGTSCDDKDQFDFNQHNIVAVATQSMASVTKNEATLSGKVNTTNGKVLTQIGICYATQSKPTISNEHVLKSEGLDTGAFTLYIQNLKPSTTYYYSAFATNASGTAYGDVLSFTTESGYASKLETQPATAITRISAELGGKITDNGGYLVTGKGICYSETKPLPTISDDNLPVYSEEASFKGNLTKLKAGTKYYARAYATSAVGTGYGQVVSFTTAPAILASGLSTTTVTSITSVSALVGGAVLEDNGSAVTVRGVCYSSSSNVPTINNAAVINIGSGTGTFSSQLTSLAVNTTYYARAFATNAAGTAYGPVVVFKTLLPDLPSSVSTISPSGITMNSAYTGGSIGSAGGGTISARGVVYSSSSSAPSLSNGTVVSGGSGTGSFSITLSGLQYNTTYYIRSYATNQAGTTYGNLYSFKTTLPSLPSNLTTYNATDIRQNSAYVSGYISSAGGGTISSRGIVYSSTNSSPTIGSGTFITSGAGTGSVSATLSGLTAGTTYYARIFATNEAGTAYGGVISFTTPTPYTAPTGVSTSSVSAIGSTYATFNGYVTTNGGSTITERGFVYSANTSAPTLTAGTKAVASGNSIGSFSRSVTGLTRYTTYYVRAYATNAYGTTYGSTTSFYPN
ncbi:hypothetical protein B0I21_106209 [Sphingobacterium paludis]|uniref:Fibronectin type-III domain-containing protein n=2 Tax=Sphingobacterium paludis TaxID=1476465 RepID=A0A4R7CXC5_9SPHI|nr:hypothetical protein B0I21_106209 [Sphingobacterium paludis]